MQTTPQTVAEDFSQFSNVVPGLYFFLGTLPEGTDPQDWAANHSPYFNINEKDMQLGVRVFAQMAVEYLQSK